MISQFRHRVSAPASSQNLCCTASRARAGLFTRCQRLNIVSHTRQAPFIPRHARELFSDSEQFCVPSHKSKCERAIQQANCVTEGACRRDLIYERTGCLLFFSTGCIVWRNRSGWFSDDSGNVSNLFDHLPEHVEQQRLRAVAQGTFRVRMHIY